MIIFIGDRESARPYRLFGFETIVAENTGEAREALGKIPREASAVFVTEEIFAGLGDQIKNIKPRPEAVPGAAGAAGAGAAYIREILRKALGTDMPG